MSINIRRYVDIASGVSGNGAVAQRELMGRIFSDNPKTPADAVVEFTSAADVVAYYGAATPEALRAAFYFGYVSKTVGQPRKLGFARFPKVAAPARIYGAKVGTTVAQFNALGAAALLVVTVGGQVGDISVNLAGAASLAAVATALQTAFRLEAGGQFTNSTVTYDAVSGTFIFASTTSVAATITVTPGALASALGWGAGAVLSPGVDVLTPAGAFSAALAGSNNFGSFAFVETLTEPEMVAVAAANSAENVSFMYCARTDAANAVANSAALMGYAGVALTLAPDAAQYDELLPMAVMAATQYARRNSVQSYMFQQAGLTAKVTTDALATTYDNLRVNYYGETQTAGQKLAFYQRGVLTGPATAPVDMNTYANEAWFKDAASAAIMSLFLSVGRIPANAEGRAQMLATLQGPIEAALVNGTISVGRALTTAQKLAVGTATGDPEAYFQVQAIGYWVDVRIVPYNTQDGRVEYKAVYTLVYAKDDTVRKVEGAHVLV